MQTSKVQPIPSIYIILAKWASEVGTTQAQEQGSDPMSLWAHTKSHNQQSHKTKTQLKKENYGHYGNLRKV